MKLESNFARNKGSSSRRFQSESLDEKQQTPDQGAGSNSQIKHQGETPSAPFKSSNRLPSTQNRPNLYAKQMLGRCYHCNQPGHRSNDYPQRAHQANLVEENSGSEKEYLVEEYNDGRRGIKFVAKDEGDHVTFIIQNLLLDPRVPLATQRNAIFRTRCTINKRVCEVIIDNEKHNEHCL